MPQSEPVFLGLNEGTWFAVIALLLTMIVSTAATVIGYRSASKDRESRIVLSHMDRQHEESMAREEREQTRRLTAYSEFAGHLDRMAEWTRRTLPIMEFSPAPPMPVVPDTEELRRQIAAVRLVGSPDVRTALDGLWKANTEFQIDVWRENYDREHPAPSNATGDERLAQWKELEAKRAAILEAITRIEDCMRADLKVADLPGVGTQTP